MLRLAALLCLALAMAGGPKERGVLDQLQGEREHASAGAVAGRPARQSPRDSIRDAIRSLLASDVRPASVGDRRWRLVQRVYEARAGEPIWADVSGLRPQAVALTRALSAIPDEGLRLSAYPLTALYASLVALRTKPDAPDRLAAADVALTALYASLGDDLLTGQTDPRSVTQGWHIDPQLTDVVAPLVDALDAPAFEQTLNRLRPEDPEYGALRRALARYRALAARGWPRVPGPASDLMRPGDTTSLTRIESLRARLLAEGYAEQVAPPEALRDSVAPPERRGVYGLALASSVAAYQARHGLVADSIVGPSTLSSLNRSAAYRARQIAANLERHRWLPRELGARYVLVNVPAFRLTVHDSGRVALTMKVVVGAEYDARATPVFSDSMAYVVFRPYWNVPASIAAKELWPAQRRDPTFFSRHGYEVVHASWGRYVRQKPGPENALGLVKFIFPNDFHVYLHDTPAVELFEENVRAFSHGCIRVEKPAELAAYVLGWPIERAGTAMYQGRDNHRVNLDRKLPVYIAYFTAYTRRGELYFARDIYDRDDALVRALRGAVAPSDTTLRRAEAIGRLARQLASDGSPGRVSQSAHEGTASSLTSRGLERVLDAQSFNE